MEKKERLFSLDALRGLDMLLLVIVGPLIQQANVAWHFPAGFMGQFRHGWECFTLWDIIMPLFIFMCGAAVPLALERRLNLFLRVLPVLRFAALAADPSVRRLCVCVWLRDVVIPVGG